MPKSFKFILPFLLGAFLAIGFNDLTAAQNNAKELYKQASDFEKGKSGPIDLDQAKNLYLEAAKQKHLASIVRLAFLREKEAQSKNEFKTIELAYRWGVAHCSNLARTRLANTLEKGLSGNIDVETTKLLYLELAQNNAKAGLEQLKRLWPNAQVSTKTLDRKHKKEAKAQFKKGADFEQGENGTSDLDEAEKNYIAAAELGYHPAVTSLALLREKRAKTEQDYAALIPEYSWASSKCDRTANYQLGNIFELGLAGDQDLSRAVYHYKNAAIRGHKASREKLKRMGEKWLTFETVNVRFLSQSSETNVSESNEVPSEKEPDNKVNSEELFLRGLALDKPKASSNDTSKARAFYEQAATKGHIEAGVRLALLDEATKPSDEKWRQIKDVYEHASTRGSTLAITRLAYLHENGLAGEVNKESAIFYYEQAAARGSQDAATALARLQQKPDSQPLPPAETAETTEEALPVFSLNDEATQTTTPTEAKSQEAEPDKTVPQETKTPETNPETTTKEQPEATPTIQLSSPKEEDKPSAQTVETATPATEQKDGLNKQEIALLEQILQSITVQPSEVWWQGEQLEALTPAYLLSANTSEISKAKLRELVTTKLPLKECATRGSWLAIISVLAIDELSELSSSTLKKQQRRCRTATLQRLLSDLGHYGGKIDGRAGVQTWTAIESYNKTTSKKIAAKVTNQAVLELAKTLVAIRQY